MYILFEHREGLGDRLPCAKKKGKKINKKKCMEASVWWIVFLIKVTGKIALIYFENSTFSQRKKNKVDKRGMVKENNTKIHMSIVIRRFRTLRFVSWILRKAIRIYLSNPIYKWILGFRCESYDSILISSNLRFKQFT